MDNQHVAYVFDMSIEMDSRAQKEIHTLIDSGYVVHVLEWNKDENYELKRKSVFVRGRDIAVDSIGIKVEKAKGIRENFRYLMKYELQLLKWLRDNRKKFEVIHCVNLDTSFASLIQAKRFGKKIIYDIFDDYADSHNCKGYLYLVIKKIDYWVIKKCNAVIICSEKRRAQIIHPVENFTVIHNSPDISIPPNVNPTHHKKMRIAYVGNLTYNRMISELLAIVSKHPEWELHCGGDGPLRGEVEKYAEDYENINYHGRLRYEEVIKLERDSDVIPAIYDPSLKNNRFAAPNKFYEAICLGKPTIMNHHTGMDDVVEERGLGKTIDNTEQSLEQALCEINQEIDKWRLESDRIRTFYRNNYDWMIMRERLLSIYKRIGEQQ